ncbi:MAG: hypothetical protein GXP27_08500 [Planctomycetes bacterium]|nr:hypothetical protein [Planctomycetota bacterium]
MPTFARSDVSSPGPTDEPGPPEDVSNRALADTVGVPGRGNQPLAVKLADSSGPAARSQSGPTDEARRSPRDTGAPANQNGARPIDPHKALKQPIYRFQQTRPVTFRELLWQVQEMAGVPIEFDPPELEKQVADKQVTLTLRRTTVGDILRALAAKVGLVVHIQKRRVCLGKPDA